MNRTKSLKEMDDYELVGWLRALCNKWISSRYELKTDTNELHEEMKSTMTEVHKRFG